MQIEMVKVYETLISLAIGCIFQIFHNLMSYSIKLALGRVILCERNQTKSPSRILRSGVHARCVWSIPPL